ncbi:MAG: rRNA (guanine966-N2)-methyltransferase [Verrucomicrobiota bacterium]|jgi:16S rRNA (guanine966-N2)-methyltransferase|nr:rRNA (guanine966-N2)-methyltransferase [Verrucomicrobiota bacterium]
MSIFPPFREQRKGTLHLPSQMRVIAGLAGGIRLKIPPHDLRPTMDMVREAAFSSLAELVADARVLDLFAGSGAYGIEALSRGAGDAIFVDDHPKSIETIRFNLLHTKLSGKVVRSDVFRFLQKQDERYRLVFADPPYTKKTGDRDYVRDLMENESLVAAMEPGGVLVLECSPVKELTAFRFWEIIRAKKYGATKLLFCTPKELPG